MSKAARYYQKKKKYLKKKGLVSREEKYKT